MWCIKGDSRWSLTTVIQCTVGEALAFNTLGRWSGHVFFVYKVFYKLVQPIKQRNLKVLTLLCGA